MRKVYIICYRDLDKINTYFPTESFKKWYYINVLNQFHTYSEAANFIYNPENSSKFDENVEYYIQEIFIKTNYDETKQGF